MIKLFDPNYLKQLCKKYDLVPRRRYGQNFLINSEPVEAMIKAAELAKDDTVIEVGPGFGALTFALAEKAGRIIAFEIEKKLKEYWEKETKRYGDKLQLVWGNVLRFKEVRSNAPGGLHPPAPLTGGKYKVVSNLPYQITSNVIRMFLESENPPESMVLMVQKEVAERICAKPACIAEAPHFTGRRRGDMSVLSVSVQYYAEPEIITQVPRSYFWPEPKVDSAIIKVSLRGPKGRGNPPELARATSSGSSRRPECSGLLGMAPSKEIFFKVVKAGFANRRKKLFNNLLPAVNKNRDKLKQIFERAGIAEGARAQELTIEQWTALAVNLSNAL